MVKFTSEGLTASKKYRDRGETTLAKFTSSNGSVTGTLMLDPRRATGEESQELPVVVRIQYDKKKVYLRIGKIYVLSDWKALCELERTGRNKLASERKDLKAHMFRVEDMVNQLIESGAFTLSKLQERFSGISSDDRTIYSVWQKYIDDKNAEGEVGTARTNVDVERRFERTMGKNVAFADIDKSFIQKWAKMLKAQGYSVTTIGISLRTFRAVVNVCIDAGLLKGDTKEMFKDSGYNKSNSRKHEFLDVSTMKRLYDFWEKDEALDENGKELFPQKDKHALFRDLGLFLFMYLADGQNLADTLRLTYDDWYFVTGGKQIRFYRHKTRDRNESASEVIFPVTLELKKILDKYGNKPKSGSRIFPIMKEDITPEQELWVIQRYNRYIRIHMKKAADLEDSVQMVPAVALEMVPVNA